MQYARDAGFRVEAHDISDTRLELMGQASGIPEAASSCHIAQIGGYAIAGHVPVEAIRRMLREKPRIVGLSVPGMVAGTPGMGAPGPHYDVIAINRDGSTSVYERR